MLCLGIESTAHTIGIGICQLKKGKIAVLSNAAHAYRPPKGQGIIPRLAAQHHVDHFGQLLRDALLKANLSLEQIDLFAFSRGPGIGQCLRVSCAAAKFLASYFGKPILGINHCHAHLEISKGLLGMKDPLFVYVSGANTQLIIENKGKPRFLVLGETLDMGLGNMFDSFAREAGLKVPHGSEVARLAQKGKFFLLPYTVKGMNFAFAGLLTSALKARQSHRLEDVCRALLETSFAEICEAAERALCLYSKKEVVVCGGVAQNERFCQMLSSMCKLHNARLGVVEPQYNADNGAMIAYTALSEWQKGKREKLSLLMPDGYWRIDQVN
ncbi:MAG: tRNA (adenosine(37)-N6)-threonylcarbamoyltransferase complex transferase subunit TsaD [Candidatus Micrarchaeota archaeon]|nr:tRNA (adenosine(37)-N6)-threonylcarbamoyltransferase complex transferase subunit TsaD [Candidatus Micrarchaeota archaeon]